MSDFSELSENFAHIERIDAETDFKEMLFAFSAFSGRPWLRDAGLEYQIETGAVDNREFPMRERGGGKPLFIFEQNAFNRFSDSFTQILNIEGKPEDVVFTRVDARKIYIGTGLARYAVEDDAILAAKSGREAFSKLQQYFSGSQAISQLFKELFLETEIDGRPVWEHTKHITSEGVTEINLLRICFGYLFDAYPDCVGIPLNHLIAAARQSLFGLQTSQHNYVDFSTKVFNRPPQEGHRMFFDTLPSWLIALTIATTPSEIAEILPQYQQE